MNAAQFKRAEAQRKASRKADLLTKSTARADQSASNTPGRRSTTARLRAKTAAAAPVQLTAEEADLTGRLGHVVEKQFSDFVELLALSGLADSPGELNTASWDCGNAILNEMQDALQRYADETRMVVEELQHSNDTALRAMLDDVAQQRRQDREAQDDARTNASGISAALLEAELADQAEEAAEAAAAAGTAAAAAEAEAEAAGDAELVRLQAELDEKLAVQAAEHALEFEERTREVEAALQGKSMQGEERRLRKKLEIKSATRLELQRQVAEAERQIGQERAALDADHAALLGVAEAKLVQVHQEHMAVQSDIEADNLRKAAMAEAVKAASNRAAGALIGMGNGAEVPADPATGPLHAGAELAMAELLERSTPGGGAAGGAGGGGAEFFSFEFDLGEGSQANGESAGQPIGQMSSGSRGGSAIGGAGEASGGAAGGAASAGGSSSSGGARHGAGGAVGGGDGGAGESKGSRRRAVGFAEGAGGGDGREDKGGASSLTRFRSFEELRQWLATLPLFRGLTSYAGFGSFIEALSKRLTPQTAKWGEHVVEKGEAGDRMYFICSGMCDVLLDLGQAPIARLAKGDFFGEEALISDQPRTATVRATKSGVEFYILSKSDLLNSMRNFPGLEEKIREQMRHRKADRQAKRDAQRQEWEERRRRKRSEATASRRGGASGGHSREAGNEILHRTIDGSECSNLTAAAGVLGGEPLELVVAAGEYYAGWHGHGSKPMKGLNHDKPWLGQGQPGMVSTQPHNAPHTATDIGLRSRWSMDPNSGGMAGLTGFRPGRLLPPAMHLSTRL